MRLIYKIKRYGVVVTNQWVKNDDGWRYADANGCALTNTWQKDSVGWCYLGDNGVMITSQWVADSAGLCYVNASGYMVTNKWVKDSVGWCYVGSNGYMTYNKWVKDSKGWCYVGSNGYMVVSKWVKDGGSWYYMDSNGYMTTGYASIDGNIYYFYNSGKMLANETVGSAYVDGSGKITGANYTYLAGADFRSERRDYPNTTARCGYVYPYIDTTGSYCVMTVIYYRLGSLDYSITTTHDFGRNKTIKDPNTYYSNLADRYYGATKIQYMTLAANALEMENSALKKGYYLHSSHAEFQY